MNRNSEMEFSLPSRWPLVPVEVAAFYLNRLPEEVIRDCDSMWAWDISSGVAPRRQLRLWRDSLIALKDPSARRNLPGRIEQVIDSFLPGRALRGRELQQLLFCHRNLIRDLERARQLEVERAPSEPGGPEASAVYSRDSVCRFLTTRTLGLPSLQMTPPPLHPDAWN